MFRELPCNSNARVTPPRTSTPSKVNPVEFVMTTPRYTLVNATSRNTMLDAPVWKTRPIARLKSPANPNTLPPAARFVLPTITTGLVATPESWVVSVTTFVAV